MLLALCQYYLGYTLWTDF